jgi:hypothetical protein
MLPDGFASSHLSERLDLYVVSDIQALLLWNVIHQAGLLPKTSQSITKCKWDNFDVDFDAVSDTRVESWSLCACLAHSWICKSAPLGREYR